MYKGLDMRLIHSVLLCRPGSVIMGHTLSTNHNQSRFCGGFLTWNMLLLRVVSVNRLDCDPGVKPEPAGQ